MPPRPYLASRGINWFGTDKLWTFLPSDGIWDKEKRPYGFDKSGAIIVAGYLMRAR